MEYEEYQDIKVFSSVSTGVAKCHRYDMKYLSKNIGWLGNKFGKIRYFLGKS